MKYPFRVSEQAGDWIASRYGIGTQTGSNGLPIEP